MKKLILSCLILTFSTCIFAMEEKPSNDPEHATSMSEDCEQVTVDHVDVLSEEIFTMDDLSSEKMVAKESREPKEVIIKNIGNQDKVNKSDK